MRLPPHRQARHGTTGALLLGLLTFAGCLGESSPGSRVGGSLGEATSALTPLFRPGALIDATGPAFELVPAFTPDGTIFVCATSGLGGGNYLWRSLDDAKTFQRLGTLVDLYGGWGPIVRDDQVDIGGGDCELTADTGGRVYLVGTWLGSVNVMSTKDKGGTWDGTLVTYPSGHADRPFAATGVPDEIFVSAAQLAAVGMEGRNLDMPPVGGIWVARSTDGGKTFPQQSLVVPNAKRLGLNGNLAFGADRLHLIYTQKVAEGQLAIVVATSADRGLSWVFTTLAVQRYYPQQCFSPVIVFPIVAADARGGVYATWTLVSPDTRRTDLYFASSPDGGRSWNTPVQLADRAGTRAYPHVAATPQGRVGVVWWETPVTLPRMESSMDGLYCGGDTPADAPWSVHYAVAEEAGGAQPGFVETLVQSTPAHKGPVGRPYGEVQTTRFDPQGRAVVPYVADLPDGRTRGLYAVEETFSVDP